MDSHSTARFGAEPGYRHQGLPAPRTKADRSGQGHVENAACDPLAEVARAGGRLRAGTVDGAHRLGGREGPPPPPPDPRDSTYKADGGCSRLAIEWGSRTILIKEVLDVEEALGSNSLGGRRPAPLDRGARAERIVTNRRHQRGKHPGLDERHPSVTSLSRSKVTFACASHDGLFERREAPSCSPASKAAARPFCPLCDQSPGAGCWLRARAGHELGCFLQLSGHGSVTTRDTFRD